MTPSTATAPKPLPVDPGDECLCTWPNGESDTVQVLAFRADGRVNIRHRTDITTEDLTVPRDFLTRLPY